MALGGLVLAVLLMAIALSQDSVRWRAEVALLKFKGDLPELSWIELTRMLNPGGPYYIENVAIRKSGYAGVRNPYTAREDGAAGLETSARSSGTDPRAPRHDR